MELKDKIILSCIKCGRMKTFVGIDLESMVVKKGFVEYVVENWQRWSKE